ncbi:hypothetical protein VTK73DRAFT_1117 [Phialemonium thermophilum]|uniref:GDS1 winged helix domain-containing protein n=1 Tax=Phialemonium thermophilum TaxID=223376 RepID=A0ABR3XBP9_9PEZI
MASSQPKENHRPLKKLKRAHGEAVDHVSKPTAASKRHDNGAKFNTPPPSPTPSHQDHVSMEDVDTDKSAGREVDLEGINDEIVEAVILQLQKTDNRPHLVKELAAILFQQLKVVQQSANPSAIISSRLSTYMKRSCWTALSPCPITKELETVHPRRTYFYLTTSPHQPLPDSVHAATLSQIAHTRAIISPSISSAESSAANSDDADSEDAVRRRELSPSPEVDLSSPEFDDMDDDIAMPSTPIGSFSMRGFSFGPHPLSPVSHQGPTISGASNASARNHRAASPPLEKDEKEFTQTADGLQKRKMGGGLLSTSASMEQSMSADLDFGTREDSGLLFGDKTLLSSANLPSTTAHGSVMTAVTSPAVKPSITPFSFGSKKDNDVDTWTKLDKVFGWDRSPESIELEELDGLLNDY